MLTQVQSALTTLISMIGDVITALTGTDGAFAALLPLLAIGIAGSVVMFGVKLVRSFTWGA